MLVLTAATSSVKAAMSLEISSAAISRISRTICSDGPAFDCFLSKNGTTASAKFPPARINAALESIVESVSKKNRPVLTNISPTKIQPIDIAISCA
jgi:hypothetical protein